MSTKMNLSWNMIERKEVYLENVEKTGLYTLVLVDSDNFEKCWMEYHTYCELTLQMSTGDYHMHKAKFLDNVDFKTMSKAIERDNYVTYFELLGEV